MDDNTSAISKLLTIHYFYSSWRRLSRVKTAGVHSTNPGRSCSHMEYRVKTYLPASLFNMYISIFIHANIHTWYLFSEYTYFAEYHFASKK